MTDRTLPKTWLASIASPFERIRRRAAASMKWSHILIWYAVVLVVGIAGTLVAYEFPGSPAWDRWSGGNHPWAVDAVRLVICTAFALFTIWNLGLLDKGNDQVAAKVLAGWRVALPIVIPIVAIAFDLTYGARQFVEGLPSRGYKGPYDFATIYRPYLPYSLYVAALWGGMGVPVFAMLLTRMKHDRTMRKASRRALEQQFRTLATVPPDAALPEFQQSQIALQNYVVRLKHIGERYIPVVLTVATLLIYEQETPSFKTYTEVAQDIGKFGLWLLLGPAVLAILIHVTFGYQAAIRLAESAYRALLERLPATNFDAREKVLAAREHLTWESSSGSFAMSIVKSTTVFVLLVSAVTLYILENLETQNRLTLFVPRVVLEFIQKIFS
jgi:hypothetical protein